MRIVFGVDGGGTSTRLRFADEGNVELWQGEGKGINPNAVSYAEIRQRLESLFAEGFSAIGRGPGDIAAGCLGVAGAEGPSERLELESIMKDRLGFACPLVFTSDPDIALVGGLKRLEGYLLIAGTGSVAIGRTAQGSRYRAGGFGHFLSDEGSAFFIGFQAIRRSIRSAEGRDIPTRLLEALQERFGFTELRDFVPFMYRSFDKASIAAAADIVDAYRNSGDELAAAIMDEAASELAKLVASVRMRSEGEIAETAVVFSGGLLQKNAWMNDRVASELKKLRPEMAPTEARESPSYGACALALQRLGGG